MPGAHRCSTVIFDCDSTLSTIEGIEELATTHRREIEVLTEAAMRGAIQLQDVYARRLALIRPTREQVHTLGDLYIENEVEDARAVCMALADEGIQVRIISGGLLPAVQRFAEYLGVAPEHVAAVDISFDASGAYSGFDSISPLARSMGKKTVIESWLPGLNRPIMMVGDGSTDLEAEPLVDVFVAYAGVVDRKNVTDNSNIVVRSRSLAPILPLALGGTAPRSGSNSELNTKGLQLLRHSEE